MSGGRCSMGKNGIGVADDRVYGEHHLVIKVEILD
jgi:hypothetical protein